MSKKVKIHAHDNPFEVVVNGKKYSYPAGEEVEVPDDVAHVIEEHNKLDAPEAPRNDITFDGTWDTLKNKPFYEETTTVGGDTLTWDGNTEGLLAVGSMYKVSDVMLTDEQIKSAVIVIGGNTINVSDSWDGLAGMGGITPEIVHLEAVAIVRKPNATMLGGSYPECGIYFAVFGTEYVNSITIANSNAFVTTTTVVKPIETKYLPEALQFGEEKAFEPIVWDGNTDGKETIVDGALLKIADNFPESNQIEGIEMILPIGQTQYLTIDQLGVGKLEDSYNINDIIYCSNGSSTVSNGGDRILLPKGMWFNISIGIQKATIIPKSTVKTLDEKYLPILTSPSGKKFKLSVDDSGVISATEV